MYLYENNNNQIAVIIEIYKKKFHFIWPLIFNLILNKLCFIKLRLPDFFNIAAAFCYLQGINFDFNHEDKINEVLRKAIITI